MAVTAAPCEERDGRSEEWAAAPCRYVLYYSGALYSVLSEHFVRTYV